MDGLGARVGSRAGEMYCIVIEPELACRLLVRRLFWSVGTRGLAGVYKMEI